MPRRGSHRQPHPELTRARAHRKREDAGDADDGDEQRDARESEVFVTYCDIGKVREDLRRNGLKCVSRADPFPLRGGTDGLAA
jgi:hypothetical protein